MSQKKRFGILVCENAPKWGGADKRGEDLVKIFKRNNEEWTFFKACEGEHPTEDDVKLFDGFLICGSASSVNDNKAWMQEVEKLIKSLAKSSTKAVGLCFGHQLIAKALGGKVGQNPSQRFVLQAEDILLADDLLEKSWAKDCLVSKNTLTLLESHREAITELPVGAKVLGKSKTCDNEIVLCGGHDNILGMQFHPELSKDQLRLLILPSLKEKNILTAEEEAFSLESFEKNLDSDVMLNIIKKFLYQ